MNYGIREVRRVVISVATGCGLLHGCIPVPYPHTTVSEGYEPGSRQNLPEHVPDFIVAGHTTREQVLAALGQPDGDAPDQSLVSYGSVWREKGTTTGIVLISIVPPGERHDVKVRVRRLLVHFDASGTVTAAELEEKECTRKYVTENHHYTTSNTTQRDCLDVRGADAVRHVADEGEMVDFEDIMWGHRVSADGNGNGNGAGTSDVKTIRWQSDYGSMTVTERNLRILNTEPARIDVLPLKGIAQVNLVRGSVWETDFWLHSDHIVITRADGSNDYLAVTAQNGSPWADSAQTRALGKVLEARRAALQKGSQ